jgi:hypothetical protein
MARNRLRATVFFFFLEFRFRPQANEQALLKLPHSRNQKPTFVNGKLGKQNKNL